MGFVPTKLFKSILELKTKYFKKLIRLTGFTALLNHAINFFLKLSDLIYLKIQLFWK